MKDSEDLMVKDLVKTLQLDQATAIKIMYWIRGNLTKYFGIYNKEKRG